MSRAFPPEPPARPDVPLFAATTQYPILAAANLFRTLTRTLSRKRERGQGMTPIAVVREVFHIPTENPDLLRSQIKAFSRQIPLLYFVVAVNADALASVANNP
jgi:hypothetical protein